MRIEIFLMNSHNSSTLAPCLTATKSLQLSPAAEINCLNALVSISENGYGPGCS